MKKIIDKFRFFQKASYFISNFKEFFSKDIKIVPVVDEEMKKTLQEMKEISKEKETQNTLQTEKLQSQMEILEEIKKLCDDNLSKSKVNEELLLRFEEKVDKNNEVFLFLLKIAIIALVLAVILNICLCVYVANNVNSRIDSPLQEFIENMEII